MCAIGLFSLTLSGCSMLLTKAHCSPHKSSEEGPRRDVIDNIVFMDLVLCRGEALHIDRNEYPFPNLGFPVATGLSVSKEALQ